MIPNPAQELHDLIYDWQSVPQNQSVSALRGDDFQAKSLRAAELLVQVRRLTLAYEASSGKEPPVLRATDDLFSLIFATRYPSPWASGSTSGSVVQLAPTSCLDSLEGFAQLVDVQLAAVTQVPPDLGALRSLVDEARDIIETDYGDALDVAQKTYLLVLIRSLDDALGDMAAFGTFNVRSLMDQLLGSLTSLAETDTDETRRGKLRSVVTSMARKIGEQSFVQLIVHAGVLYGPQVVAAIEATPHH